MLSEYFLMTRADVDDSDLSAGRHIEGPKILVNLASSYTAEPLYDGKLRPTCIAFADAEVIVMETVDEIDTMIGIRRRG